jgi:hypothetical protein
MLTIPSDAAKNAKIHLIKCCSSGFKVAISSFNPANNVVKINVEKLQNYYNNVIKFVELCALYTPINNDYKSLLKGIENAFDKKQFEGRIKDFNDKIAVALKLCNTIHENHKLFKSNIPNPQNLTLNNQLLSPSNPNPNPNINTIVNNILTNPALLKPLSPALQTQVLNNVSNGQISHKKLL